MKRSILAAILLAAMLPAGAAVTTVGEVDVDRFALVRDGRYLSVDMLLDLSRLEVSGNRAVLLMPGLVNGTDTLALPAVGVYGRRRYYYYVRNGHSMLSGADETSYMASRRPDSLIYNKVLPYQDWMNGASLTIIRREYGCCNTLIDEKTATVGNYTEAVAFFPTLVYVRPQGETVKQRSLEGSAFIDFPVNKTVIYPDYRRNTVELGKIRATIDSVRSDRDVTITQVWLKGYASPESPYGHNRELAIGRTGALKDYIQQLYRFDSGVIATDYEPEDWAGLRSRVAESNISHKAEILALIDSDREPDNKEWRIKSLYPEEYRFMLQEFYPALRHTDYRIAYTVRSYSDIDEIRHVFSERPRNLSLNELYLLSQEYEPGSDEFTEVFETAVRMYPDDETANLNAANAAMRRGDNASAARYLARAGDTPEAVYARGALAVRMEDYETARSFIRQAEALGVAEATVTLESLDKR